MDVAVIDDGVNENLYSNGPLVFNIQISESLTIKKRKGYDPFFLSHGTQCAAIIKKYAPNTGIGSIMILNENYRALPKQLERALLWCIEEKVPVINISLGTIDFHDFPGITSLVNKAASSGIIIVSALHNKNIYTLPASLSNAIGVVSDHVKPKPDREYDCILFSPAGIDFTARAYHGLKNVFGHIDRTENSNSYAAPYITARVCNEKIKNRTGNVDEIKLQLRQNCKIHNTPLYYFRPDWLEDYIVLLPDNIDDNSHGTMCSGNFNEQQPYRHCKKITVSAFDENKIRDEDTIVIPDSAIKYFYEKKKNRAKLSKLFISGNPMIVLTQKQEHLSWLQNLQFSSKIWCEPLIRNYYNIKKHKNIDIPFIVIYDLTYKYNINSIIRLGAFFMQDDYNTIRLTTDSRGILAGIDVIPEDCLLTNGLSLYRDIFNPDIILCSIQIQNKHSSIIRSIEKIYTPDIVIYIVKNTKNQFFLKPDKKTEQKKIVFIEENTEPGIGIFPVFDIMDDKSFNDCYRYIMTLFCKNKT